MKIGETVSETELQYNGIIQQSWVVVLECFNPNNDFWDDLV